jgi:hypothetical protein
MEKVDFKNMSNNDIGIELKKYENEYESVKLKIAGLIERLKELDLLFSKGKEELNNRNKGIF